MTFNTTLLSGTRSLDPTIIDKFVSTHTFFIFHREDNNPKIKTKRNSFTLKRDFKTCF